MSFLPNDYQAPPKAAHYMKLEQGDNKFRILSRPVLGWEDWTPDKKPVRYKYSPKPPKAIVEARPPKHFWSFIVWNYKDERIQILHLTQATVRDALHSLTEDKEWGAPFFYDIKINKTGEETKTKYIVTPCQARPLAAHIQNAFYETACCLDALFENANPFEPHSDRTPTPGVFSQADLGAPVKEEFSGPFEELKEILSLDAIPTEHLMEFLSIKAKEKAAPLEQVIGGALLKDFRPKFKKAYEKWLIDSQKIEEAIPF